MAEEYWIALLIAAGGLLQIIGVLLIVQEIASHRRLAAEVAAPLLVDVFEPRYAAELTERDRRRYDFRHKLLEETLRPSRAEVSGQIEVADERLRRFLSEQLVGGLRVRALGVGLIVIGLILATGGSLWSTLEGH